MTTQKRQTAVRFSATAQWLLHALTEDTGLSQSGVVELAIRDLARSRGLNPPYSPAHSIDASQDCSTPGHDPLPEIPHNRHSHAAIKVVEHDKEKVLQTQVHHSQNAEVPPAGGPSTPAASYPLADVVAFRRSEARWGGFSNMSRDYPLLVNGVTFQTLEALFQVMKFPHLPEVQHQIIAEKNLMKVAWIGRGRANTPRADWKAVRVDVMRWAVRVKLAQHWEAFGMLLLETGERPIVENSARDDFWGAIPDADGAHLVGENHLGRLLMELRDELRNSPDMLVAVPPPPIPDFLLLGQPVDAVQREDGLALGGGRPNNEESSESNRAAKPRGGAKARQDAHFHVKSPLHMAGGEAVPADVPIPQRVYCGSAIRLLAIPRPLAARFVLDEPYMVISLDSPGKDIPVIAESSLRVGLLRVLFNDIERAKNGCDLFTREQARTILDFVDAHLPEAKAILVHCTHGRNRSPAVAAALSTILQGEERFFAELHNRNRHVYNTLLAEWRSDPRPAPLTADTPYEIGHADVVTAEDAAITSFRRPFAFLSNFSKSPIEFEGVIYPSLEHAYQAAKTLDAGWRARVQATGRPDWAKRMPSRRAFPWREGWDDIKDSIMLELLRKKFSDPKRARQLLSTGCRQLIEGNIWGDRYWGMCQDDEGQWKGQNRLGEFLMQIRREQNDLIRLSVRT